MNGVQQVPGTAVANNTAWRGAAVDDEQFAQDLSLMLDSGLNLLDGLKTHRERCGTGTALVLDRVQHSLQEGETLSAAMQIAGGFKPTLVACVRSSERTGDMAQSLRRYAANAARLRKMRAQIMAALIYPVLLVSVAVCVVLFLLLYVVPRFAVVLESTGQDMPWMSQMLIALGRSLNEMPPAAWVVLGAMAVYGVWFVVMAARRGRLEAVLTEWGARVPYVRDLVTTFLRSQFIRSVGMLVQSGVPVLKALSMCASLLLRVDQDRLERVLVSAGSGQSLAQALHEEQLVDTLGLRVMRVAEQTGQLHTALDRLADILDQAVERAIERVGKLIEPLLMLGIGLVVGGIVVLMYLPIFQLAAGLQ